jgi:hypothetical protein
MGWILLAFSVVLLGISLYLAHSLPGSPLREMEQLLAAEPSNAAGGGD